MIIEVKVIPGSSKVFLSKLDREKYKVKLTASPQKGKANVQLLKVLAEYFQVSSNQVKILRGFNKPNKIIKILGIK
jgi:uncharacterized protein